MSEARGTKGIEQQKRNKALAGEVLGVIIYYTGTFAESATTPRPNPSEQLS